jgi:AbrB family looped-hinge helix DNA binding protein
MARASTVAVDTYDMLSYHTPYFWRSHMETITLSSKGQLVIPSRVRTTANLNTGDTLEVNYVDGEIRLRPVAPTKATRLDDVAGSLAKKAKSSVKPLTDAQINAAIKARLKAEDLATMSQTVKRKKSA